MSNNKKLIIANSNPTSVVVILKETINNVTSAIAIDSGDTITATITDAYDSSVIIGATVTVNTSATGSDLANGKIVAEWTQAVSATWGNVDGHLWIVRNNVPWLPAKVKIIQAP